MPELEAVATLARIAEVYGLRTLLIGAFAREIVFDQQYGGKRYRATRDIDVGVYVATWTDYWTFVDALVAAGFTHDAEHKLRYLDGTELDLLPFGGVVNENNQLAWMGGDRVMSMKGFESADAYGELRNIAGIQFRVAHLSGLITLKLFAFRDRGLDLRSSDLGDLNYIFAHASDTFIERIYAELTPALIEVLDYPELGPYLLGCEVAATVRPNEVEELMTIVNRYILAAPDYAVLSRLVGLSELEGTIARFAAFKRGLEDATKNIA